VTEKRRHRNTNGSAFHMLYLAAMKPVLHSDTKTSGAKRSANAWFGIAGRFAPLPVYP